MVHADRVRTFEEDDSAYLSWIAANPDLCVLNTERVPKPSYLILHRATCRTISGSPARGARWTAEYTKRCGTKAELEHYARSELGGSARACGLCRP